MKARIKATGEIVNLASYATIALDQCDSLGNPIELKPEEVELLQDITEDDHWRDVRERAAIAAMQSIIRELYCSDGLFATQVAIFAVGYADALVEQLKKKEQ